MTRKCAGGFPRRDSPVKVLKAPGRGKKEAPLISREDGRETNSKTVGVGKPDEIENIESISKLTNIMSNFEAKKNFFVKIGIFQIEGGGSPRGQFPIKINKKINVALK